MGKNDISMMAIISFMLGILSLTICWLPVLGLIAFTVPFVLSIIALKQIKRKELDGRGFAIAGLVLACISLVIASISTMLIIGVGFIASL